jgi:hypothetical protein
VSLWGDVDAFQNEPLISIYYKFGASIEYQPSCGSHTFADYTFVKHEVSFQNTEFSPAMRFAVQLIPDIDCSCAQYSIFQFINDLIWFISVYDATM